MRRPGSCGGSWGRWGMSDWTEGHIGDLATGIRGVAYTPDQLKEASGEFTVTLLRANNIQSGALHFNDVQFVADVAVSEAQMLTPGDIAVCMSNGSRALVGKAAQYKSSNRERATVGAFCSLFRPTSSADPGYVSYLFQSQAYRAHIDLILAGSAINNLRNKDIEALKLLIAPKQEQSAIARILDALDTQIEKTQALIAKLEQVKEGLLHDLLTRGVDENGELRPSAEEAPELYKATPLGLIPREWEASSTTAYLRDQDGIKPGPFGSSLKKESYTRTGFKVYGQEQVIAGDQSIGDYFISAAKFAELQDFEVREGDVLISLVGTVGRVLVLKSGCLPGLINPRLMRLRPNPSAVSSEFLRLILMSAGFTRQIEALAGGGTMPVINKSIVRRVVVPYVPLAEQVRIVEVEATTVRQLSDERAYRLKLQTEKSGLMDDLLTGRVRVTSLLESLTPVTSA